MKLPTVQLTSSNLASATYDPDEQTLDVEFVQGGSFTYQNVSQALYDGLIAAPSAGKFFHANIRNRGRG